MASTERCNIQLSDHMMSAPVLRQLSQQIIFQIQIPCFCSCTTFIFDNFCCASKSVQTKATIVLGSASHHCSSSLFNPQETSGLAKNKASKLHKEIVYYIFYLTFISSVGVFFYYLPTIWLSHARGMSFIGWMAVYI